MKRAQDASSQDRALNELYRRYEDRGMTYDRSPQAAEQKSRETNGGANARKSYKISAESAVNLKKHKNGAAGGRRYMTDGDFANYYRASREYTPEANVELETTILLRKISKTEQSRQKLPMKNQKNDIKKKLMAEADHVNPKNLARARANDARALKQPSKQDTSAKIKKAAKEAARTWIPLDERHTEKVVEGGKTKIPTGLIIAILVITLALLMIVGSAVFLGSAQSEQNDLEDAIEALDFQIAELETELTKKNEDIDVEIYATEVLGMINREHVSAEYIISSKTDGVIKRESDKVSVTSLIKWIFQNLK